MGAIVWVTPRRVVTRSTIVETDPLDVAIAVVSVDRSLSSFGAFRRVISAEDWVGRRSDRSRRRISASNGTVEARLIVVCCSVVRKPVP